MNRLLILICPFFMLSCTAQHISRPMNAIESEELRRSRLGFEAEVQSILAAKCFDCHNSSKREGDVDLTSEEGLLAGKFPVIVPGNPEESLLIQVILSNEMPYDTRERVTEEELEYLKVWIKSRDPRDQVSTDRPMPPVIVEGGPVTFARVLEEIFEPKCSRCHAGASAEDFVDLTNLESIKTNFMYSDLIVKGNPSASRIYRAVASGRMPRQGLKLSAEELALLRLWIFEGPDL